VNFLPLARLHLLIGFRGSGSLMTMISAENAEFSQDNRKRHMQTSTPRARFWRGAWSRNYSVTLLKLVVTASHSCGGRSIFAWEERTLKRPAPFNPAQCRRGDQFGQAVPRVNFCRQVNPAA
jgi:hypothetical protein